MLFWNTKYIAGFYLSDEHDPDILCSEAQPMIQVFQEKQVPGKTLFSLAGALD